jgi:hypothetical protein
MDDESKYYVSIGLGVLAVVLLLLFWEWSTVVNSIVRADLEDYARQTRSADMPLSTKEPLLDAIESLETKIEDGSNIGLFRWRRCDKAVRELLVGQLNTDKAKLIERELRRLERKESSK